MGNLMESVTQKVLGLVEEKTGVPVIAKADPSLSTLAALHVARHGAHAHIVAYNPTLGSRFATLTFLLRENVPFGTPLKLMRTSARNRRARSTSLRSSGRCWQSR